MLIECEQTMLAVNRNAIDKIREPLNELSVGVLFVIRGGRTHVDLKLESMKRVAPRSHLRVHKRAAAVRTETGNVNVMIDEPRRIDIVESPFDQIRRALTDFAGEFLWFVRECSADVVDETH